MPFRSQDSPPRSRPSPRPVRLFGVGLKVRPARLLRHPEHVLGQILLVGERKQHWRHLKADKQGHHIGRYPLDEPEAKFHGFQEFLAGRSCRAVFRAASVLGAFSRTSSAVFSVESGAGSETVVETGGFDCLEDGGFERASGATSGASEYCTIAPGGGL